MHHHDIGVLKAGEGLRLGDKTVESPAEGIDLRIRHRHHRAIMGTYCQVGRQKFLDRYFLIEIRVTGEVGDTESALTQDALDFIPVQTVSRR